MKRFMIEHLSWEKQFLSEPQRSQFIKRAQALKMQIDVLSRENERILNVLDETERR